MPSIPSTITFFSLEVLAVGPDWQQVSTKDSNKPGSHAHFLQQTMIGLSDLAGTMILLAWTLASPVSEAGRLGTPGCLLYTTRQEFRGLLK